MLVMRETKHGKQDRFPGLIISLVSVKKLGFSFYNIVRKGSNEVAKHLNPLAVPIIYASGTNKHPIKATANNATPQEQC